MTTSIPTAAPAPATTAPTATGPLGRIIAASVATGASAAAIVTFAALPDASEARVVGGALLALATGWAMLAWLTTAMTTRPQRWSYVPAAVMASAGTVLLLTDPREPAATHLAWVWAPTLVVLAVWIERRTRSGIGGRRAALLYPVILVMLLAGLGGLYQATTQAPDVAAGPMPGRLVDVGGYRLHLNCTGSGTVTVVLLNGLGETSPQWARIIPSIAQDTRICAYDRAGQGWSEDSDNPADAMHAANDLHRLLTAAGEAGPYVLAGHSTGGVHALTYTHLYPSEVAGVVLVDSASPHQVDLVKPFNGEYQLMRRALAVAPTLFRFGTGHITRAMSAAALPGKAGEQAAVFAHSPRGWAGMRAEQAMLPDTFRQAQALTTLADTPLVVLTARETVDRKAGWDTAQIELAALSSNARHTVADLDHAGFLHDPQGAALTVAAITDVLTSARTHTPLARP